MNKEKDANQHYSSIEATSMSSKLPGENTLLNQQNTHDIEKAFPVENTEDVIKYSHLLLEGK